MIKTDTEPETVGPLQISKYRSEDGELTVSNYRSENGLMIVFHDSTISSYSNSNHGDEFNGLLLNMYILGSASRTSSSYSGERMAGCANIARPWTSFVNFETASKRVVSVSIVTLMNDYKLNLYTDESDKVLGSLMERYLNDGIQIALSDLAMAYCYALYRLHMESRLNFEDALVNDLVTGLLLELYSNDQRVIVSESYKDHVIADNIFVDLLSKPMVIDRDCFDEIYEEYGISKYKGIRLFKKRYGMTPYSYFKRTRLQMAAALLLTGDTSIQVVASRVGYASESKFAMAFKEQYGVRPKHFLSHLKEL